MQIYNAGLDALATWTTGTFNWMLLKAGTFDGDADNVAAILSGAADEITVSGYAREAASGKARTVDDTNNRITYTAADPDFGTLVAGESVTAVLLYKHVTSDSDAVPVGWWTITSTPTAAIDPFELTLTDGIVAYVDQAA